MSNPKAPGLFLDRDGVINVTEPGVFVNRARDFRLCTGIIPLCHHYAARGHRIIVVTNQAGIDEGHLTAPELHRIHAHMSGLFADRGIRLAGIYYCPDYSETHRKPAPGMILDAAQEHNIDLPASTLIGDRDSDIEAGRRAGIGTNILIKPNQVAELLM